MRIFLRILSSCAYVVHNHVSNYNYPRLLGWHMHRIASENMRLHYEEFIKSPPLASFSQSHRNPSLNLRFFLGFSANMFISIGVGPLYTVFHGTTLTHTSILIPLFSRYSLALSIIPVSSFYQMGASPEPSRS